jgi:hypothetical protein
MAKRSVEKVVSIEGGVQVQDARLGAAKLVFESNIAPFSKRTLGGNTRLNDWN